ncbi:DUF1275 family protein [Cupriavidus sp. USMAHM13]|uniref:YoaK family protein n=1 Tax=Cupriavidus sp. USMAHM13 TaxID=1389192 RepID=UPI0008A678C1|nr:DUF1275 family protein [Cupriavidus sp. USMAHM13]AOZ03774.1 DUF1275 family protein [Cupriavidus sp. USMAHM13]
MNPAAAGAVAKAGVPADALAGQRRLDLLLGTLFAFVAGYVDAVGFVALSGLFTAHVTGNFIMIGIGVAGHPHGLLLKLLALPAFIVSVAATRLAEGRLIRSGRAPVPPLLLAQCALLAGFMLVGLRAVPNDPGTPAALAAGLLGVAAMGVQNALSRTVLARLGPTTIMTGNTTQIVIDLVDLPFAEGERRADLRARLAKMAPAVGAFAAGAVLGALAHAGWSLWSLLVPLLLLVAVDLYLWRGQPGGSSPPGH